MSDPHHFSSPSTIKEGGQDRRTRMEALLEKALSPSSLMIRDDSARHKHHAHAPSEKQNVRGPQQIGETHYVMEIVSERFDSLRPLARHRLVNDILADEFKNGLHALSLTLKGSKEI